MVDRAIGAVSTFRSAMPIAEVCPGCGMCDDLKAATQYKVCTERLAPGGEDGGAYAGAPSRWFAPREPCGPFVSDLPNFPFPQRLSGALVTVPVTP